MADDSIFSKEILDALTVSEENSNKGPVTVLGKTFANDDERRAYFREELRKKLPELKKIEGFPIGADDDIVNLSDPPYYTACPNPWINDFIKEWEADKVRLQAEGKRTADFEVKEPYSSDVSEGKNNPVYTAHTYHTKVPHPAIMRYILHYTQPGDVVLDGFAGTGMTGVAAAACSNDNDDIAARINNEWMAQFGTKPNWGARHAICGDLSPYATNIAYFYNSPVNPQALTREVKRIEKEMEEECGWMYKTTNSLGKPVGKISFVVWSDVMVCPNCGEEYVFWNQAVDHEKECVLDEFECPHCHALQSKKTASTAMETYFDEALKKTMSRVKSVPVIVVAKAGNEKIQRAPNDYDFEVLKKIEETDVRDWFPTYELPDGQETQRNVDRGITHVHQFYTKRNLIVLSRLYAKIEASPMAHALRFIFTGMINRSTKMNRVHVNNYFKGGGGWNGGYLKGTLYVPNAPTETSVLEQIGDKLSAAIHANDILAKCRPNVQYVASADNLTLSDNSVDYIFIDPPFGANINYSELNSLPEPWLKVVTNNGHEAIENRAQGKTAQTYRDTMAACFREYFRVLKPGRWMTVEFSNTSAAVWNSIQNALQSSGFVIVNVAALDKKQGSFNAVTSTTAVKQDLVITCFKPTSELTTLLELSSDKEANVWDFVEELLEHLPVHIKKDNSTTAVVERSPKILFDRLIAYYVQKGYPVPLDASTFQKGLKERFVERDGMYFTATQANEYEEKKKDTTGFNNLFVLIGSEAEGIEWLKRKLEESPMTYSEIQPEWMKDLVNPKKGDTLPELMQILDENFIKEPDGKWRLPNIQDDVDKNQLRTKALLREFKLYVEQASKPKAKIKEVRVEAVRAGFKDCYIRKDFQTIVMVGDKIPQNLLTEDEILLQFYDIAVNHV